jgi:hypothetical protein
VDEFIKLLGNRIFPPGSITLISSPSHLGKVGLSAYVNDLLWAEKELKVKLGRETVVRPLPTLLLPGCSDATLIRDIYDLAGWFKQSYAGDRYHLGYSYGMAVEAMNNLGEGKQRNLMPIRYRLPGRAGLGPELVSCIDFTSCHAELPESIKPASCNKEKDLVVSIIRELREKMALDLDSNPAFARGLVLQVRAKTTVDFLVIGSDSANKLARALDGMRY